MSVTDLTGLWRMAATLMGEKGVNVVLDATTPTTPVEVTFNAIYDEVRIEHLKRLRPDFAKQSAPLIEAPTRNFDLEENFWIRPTNERWDFIYRMPENSIKFLGFVQDQEDLAARDTASQSIYRNPWKIHNLPIKYREDAGLTPTVYEFTSSLVTATGTLLYVFPGSILIEFRDVNNGVLHRIGDAPDGTYDSNDGVQFNLYPLDDVTREPDTTTPLITSSTDRTYAKINDLVFSVTDLQTYSGWDPDLSGVPQSIDMQYATQLGLGDGTSEFHPHIHTNLEDAEGVYIQDSTDIADWSTEFIISVAHELARRGAMVHSKSSRIVSALNGEKERADFLLQISEAENDDGSLDADVMSSTERARL